MREFKNELGTSQIAIKGNLEFPEPEMKARRASEGKGGYDERETETSAAAVARFIWNLYEPRSVLDIGCSKGWWLKAFQELGAPELLGFDGPWVREADLLIEPSRFQSVDLSQSIPTPTRKFDLAICLEVVEHLPPNTALQVANALTGWSDVILFSAGIPLQGGVGHINERWQSYWAQHFLNLGYGVVDSIRPTFWNDRQVSWWYAQNMLMFIRLDVGHHPKLLAAYEATRNRSLPLDIVHPARIDRLNASLGRALRVVDQFRRLAETVGRTARGG